MAEINLSKYGITGTTEIVHNPSYEELFKEEMKPELEGYEKGQETELGAVNVMTGIYTGRSPKDKFIVEDENSKNTVWWTSDEYKNDNHRMSQETWAAVKDIAKKELSNKRLFVVDAFCGANKDTRMAIRFIVEVAWQAHFVTNMFIKPTEEELKNFEPDFVVYNASKAKVENYKELGPGEIVVVDENSCKTLVAPGDKMKICTFLWVYYGYPSSSYEGVSVEQMRYNCGKNLAKRDNVRPDIVAGVPDSGTAHAVGYSNESGIPFSRPFIKYTPTWPRSFMPTIQSQRNMIAKMKLIAVHDLIKGKKLLLIDDSIVRGTQLRETTEFLYKSGAKEVHIRPACPPLVYGCKFLNFSRSSSEMDLITRRVIARLEGTEDVSDDVLQQYADPDSPKYEAMVEEIRKELNFTSLRYNRLDDMLAAVGIPEEKLCTYCWNGKDI